MSLGKRYELRRLLGQGGMGVVHEAYDQLKDRLVALKQLKVLSEDAKKKMSFASETEYRLTLAKEFQILASLRHPNIVSVYDYGFTNEGIPYFTMEYLENAPSILAAGIATSLEEKVTLLIELLQALAYLHRHNIIHRDVKPENVLVADGRVKTLDFGLAIARTDDFKLKANAIAGTYAYIAPEVFEGYTPTRASDLWSVGVIAFELFGNQYPFNAKTLNMLIADVLMRDADVASLGLPTQIEMILERLLMRDPELRYHDAFAVIDAFNRALGKADSSEPEHIRESFLQTPKFVGREEELRQLRVALESALEQNTGSSWLIGGESGVGKSRLIDEIRSLALVKGFTVLTGQGASSGLPYQLWRGVMRPLVFEADLSLIQKQVLKEIVPDIELLLDENIPDAPALEGAAGKQRLMITIADVLLASEQPLLLLLEDLHWASDSLDPLTALSEQSTDKTLMLIGTYRNDETPALPDPFPMMQTLTLERLSRDEMTALSTSILGDFGKKDDVVTLLEQQTEGNCFFIEEVMREIVLTAGRIHNVSSIELPSEIFTVSMDAMLSKRLDKVRDTYEDALVLSAIYGRDIDQTLLQTALPDLPIDEFLYATDNAAVLNVRSDNWSFAHDKLRESILRDLDDTARQTRHRQVAEAIETTYADNDDYDEHLLHHWHHADDRDKEFTYLEKTVFRLIYRRPSYNRCADLIDRSLTHYDENDPRYIQMLVEKAEAVRWSGNFVRAEAIADGALSLARKQNAQALIGASLRVLTPIYGHQGKFSKASASSEEGIQIFRDLGDQDSEASLLNAKAATLYITGELEKALSHWNQSLALYRKTNNTRRIPFVMASLGSLEVRFGNYQKALDTLNEALGLVEADENLRYSLEIRKCYPEILLKNDDVTDTLYALINELITKNMMPIALFGIATFAVAFIQKKQFETASKLMAFAKTHPASGGQTLYIIGDNQPTVIDAIGDSQFLQFYDQGAQLSLEETLKLLNTLNK